MSLTKLISVAVCIETASESYVIFDLTNSFNFHSLILEEK